MRLFLWGALATLSWVIALFFFRFWRRGRDRFFLLFSMAFVAFGLNWVALSFLGLASDQEHYTYVVRLMAFALIIAAIVDKNRQAPPSR